MPIYEECVISNCTLFEIFGSCFIWYFDVVESAIEVQTLASSLTGTNGTRKIATVA
jgi:hypothetical protein